MTLRCGEVMMQSVNMFGLLTVHFELPRSMPKFLEMLHESWDIWDIIYLGALEKSIVAIRTPATKASCLEMVRDGEEHGSYVLTNH